MLIGFFSNCSIDDSIKPAEMFHHLNLFQNDGVDEIKLLFARLV